MWSKIKKVVHAPKIGVKIAYQGLLLLTAMTAKAMAFVVAQPIIALAYNKIPWLLGSWLLVRVAPGQPEMDSPLSQFGYSIPCIHTTVVIDPINNLNFIII